MLSLMKKTVIGAKPHPGPSTSWLIMCLAGYAAIFVPYCAMIAVTRNDQSLRFRAACWNSAELNRKFLHVFAADSVLSVSCALLVQSE